MPTTRTVGKDCNLHVIFDLCVDFWFYIYLQPVHICYVYCLQTIQPKRLLKFDVRFLTPSRKLC